MSSFSLPLDFSSFHLLDEEELKKKVLENNDHSAIDSFKKYLDLLILKKKIIFERQTKLDLKSELKSKIEENSEKKLNEKIHNKIEKVKTKPKNEFDPIIGKISKFDRDSKNEKEEQREADQQKSQMILETSKKLKDRMRIEKIDASTKFYKNKMKQFTVLDTFIDVKEFINSINPLNEKKLDKSQNRSLNLNNLRKIQKESNDYFDDRIKQFNERMEELNQNNDSDYLKGKDEEQDKDISIDEDDEFEKARRKMEEQNSSSTLPRISPRGIIRNSYAEPWRKEPDTQIRKSVGFAPGKLSPKPPPPPPAPSPALPTNEIDFHNNFSFLESQGDINKSLMKVFKEFYDPKGKIKKTKKKTESEILFESLHKHLQTTDGQSKPEYMRENKRDEQDDPFFKATLHQLDSAAASLQKGGTSGQGFRKDEEIELRTIERLENIIKNIIHAQDHKKDEIIDSNLQLRQFKEKSKAIISLIDRTSRTIFRELHPPPPLPPPSPRRATENISSPFLTSIPMLASTPLLLSPSYSVPIPSSSSSVSPLLPSQMTRMSTESVTFVNKGNDQKIKNTRFSHTFRVNEEEDNAKRFKHSKSIEMRGEEEVNFLDELKGEGKVQKFLNKKFRKKVQEGLGRILEQTEEMKERTGEGELKQMERESWKFFEETKRKIDPPLESIVSTLDKRDGKEKRHFKMRKLPGKKSLVLL